MRQLKEDAVVGALLIVAASTCFAGAGMFVQLASPQAGEYVVSFAGFAVASLIALPLALLRGRGFLASQHTGMVAARSVVGVVQVAVLFFALQTIPLVDGILLRDAAPLWIPLILWAFWRESMPKRLWLGILLGFVGMALVLHPSYSTFEVGYLLGLACGVLFAFQSILSRRVDQAGEPVLRTLCYIFPTGVVLMALPAALQWHPMAIETWLNLVLVGVLLLISTSLLLTAYFYAPAYVLAPFGYTSVVASALIDWWVFGLVPSRWTVLGAVLVIGAGILIIRLSRVTAK